MKRFCQLVFLFFATTLFLFSSPKTLAQSTVNLNELTLSSATILVKDLKTSAAWYRKFLKFKIKEYKPDKHVKMERGNFQLTLSQGNNTLLLREITFTKGKKYVNGIDKIGFSVNQFDSLDIYLQRYEQKYVKPVGFDENLGMRSMIVQDPEGNQVLFFDEANDGTLFSIEPTFFSINSSDYITTYKWYTENLGFSEIKLKDDSNAHFQNFLQKDHIILELIHLPYESLETTEFMPLDRDLASFDQLVFRMGLAKKVIFELDNNGNKIVLKQ